MIMGEDSYLRVCGFESRHCILDGHDIFHIDCYLKRPKINEKEARLAHCLKKTNRNDLRKIFAFFWQICFKSYYILRFYEIGS